MSFLQCQNRNITNKQPHSYSLSKSRKFLNSGFISPIFPRKQAFGKAGRISSYTLRGSLTLEASIIVPLFLFFCVTLTSLLEQYRTYSVLTAAVQQVGNELSVEDQPALSGQIQGQIEGAMSSNRGRDLEVKNMTYLSGKFSYTLQYREDAAMNLWGLASEERGISYSGHLWIGYDVELSDPRDSEIYVFVTPTGVVYHRSRNCTHLKLSVYSVPASQVSGERNQYGERYQACERCHGRLEGMVYLTEEGTRYHSDISCSGLRRSVRSIPLSEAQLMYAPCSRCGGN